MAQSGKQVTYQRIGWVRYSNRLQLSERVAFVAEVDNRVFLSEFREQTFSLRSAVRYTFHPQIDATLGFTYAQQYPQNPESDLVVPELRPQQDITLKQEIGKVKLNHQYRLEERFIRKTIEDELASGYRFNFRFRYRLQGEVPLWHGETQEVKLVVSDEVMLNAGKSIEYNTFDQNRLYGGVQWEVSPALALELGYMKWHQQRPSGSNYFNRDVARLSVSHKLQLY
ncbi:DUF2490 domain-containing protein [Pontibacter ruber]|uniref:DUF2490 domain-containing protein n=1 Tax=Pontibacter ruber TaxID=1343895 RepID=A0ABW5CUH0_9BACT|nr:DUF2490 domain-containing protein [Pontibacter ruber]